MTTEWVPSPAQAAKLKILADDGSPNFGEKLANYQLLHEAKLKTGEDCCPCLTCDPKGEWRLTG